MPGRGGPEDEAGPGRPDWGRPELRASHADRDRVVETLRVSAGEGRLTAEELEERVEAALTARTVGELVPLTADLPDGPEADGASAAPEAKELVRIEQRFSTVRRTGRWVVPRRMVLDTEWCDVLLDFTQAVVTHRTLALDVDMRGKTLTLLTRPGIEVDCDDLVLKHCRLTTEEEPPRHEAPPSRAIAAVPPAGLHIALAGRKIHGRVVVQPPRRSLGERLRGRFR